VKKAILHYNVWHFLLENRQPQFAAGGSKLPVFSKI